MALLIVLVYLILKPFLITILSSIILAYLFYPVYLLLKRLIKVEWLSALLVCILIVILFTIPIILLSTSIIKEARQNYIMIRRIVETGSILEQECADDSFACMAVNNINEWLANPEVQYYLTNSAKAVTDFVINGATEFVFTIPFFILKFFISLFIIFFLLREGSALKSRTRQLLPLKKAHQINIFDHLSNVTRAVVHGHLLTTGSRLS